MSIYNFNITNDDMVIPVYIQQMSDVELERLIEDHGWNPKVHQYTGPRDPITGAAIPDGKKDAESVYIDHPDKKFFFAESRRRHCARFSKKLYDDYISSSPLFSEES